MLDPQEPKNGDFASYVEHLTRQPPPQRPADTATRPAPARPTPRRDDHAATSPSARWGRSGDTAPGTPRGGTPGSAQDAPGAARGPIHVTRARAIQALEQAVDGLRSARAKEHAARPDSDGARAFVGAAATVLTLVGLVVLLSALLDDPPFFADPFTGIALIVFARFLSRILGKRP